MTNRESIIEALQKEITNREYIIKALQNPNSDESDKDIIYHNICCSYGLLDERGECYGKSWDEINPEMCVRCKEKWLDSEVEE